MRKYTDEEKMIIRRHVSENTNNLQEGFKAASFELCDRSPKAVAQYWYKVLSTNTSKTNTLFCTVGKLNSIPNRKVAYPNKTNIVTSNMWQKILKILFK